MIGASINRKSRIALFTLLSLLLAAGPVELLAKGFSGGGGARGGGGFRSSPSRSSGSKSFSGSNSARRSTASRPSYDRAAGSARQREVSAGKFNAWRSSRSAHETPSFNPSLADTRAQRQATVFGTRQPTGYYREPPNVVIYRDSYDNGFMKYVGLMWLFNHWNTVDRSRFDEQRVRELEAKFRDLEARGYKRDPNYREPGIDPDLAYSKEAAYADRGPGFFGKLFRLIMVATLITLVIWFIFIRRIPYKSA